MNLQRSSIFMAAGVLLSQIAAAQITFSIEHHGPTRAMPDCGMFAPPITEGDILAPCFGGFPAVAYNPMVPGPMAPPTVLITGGFAGLGLGSHAPCVGVPPGVVPCAFAAGSVEVDAFSYGLDGPYDGLLADPATGIRRKGHWHFSVDEHALGAPGIPITPTVASEGVPGVIGVVPLGDAPADVFVDLGLASVPGTPPFVFGGAATGHNGVIDGNGRLSISSLFTYPATGIIEPSWSPPFGGLPPDPGDNLDAVDVDDGTGFGPVYYSMSSAFADPRTGAPGSFGALSNGFVGGDIVVTVALGAGPAIFSVAPFLGLDMVAGPDSDDVDALILWENGTGFHEPSMMPYDWLGGGTDMLLFSVRTGSAVIGMPDSIHGAPIEPGDILTTPLAGGVSPFPGIFIPCEQLGLQASVARNPLGMPFGDDVDALDYKPAKSLLAQEYCYGDGGVNIGGMQCTGCPFGNNMPAGTQAGCMNANGTGARLTAGGLACASADSLQFVMQSANPLTFAMLVCANSRLPLALACPPGSGISQPALLDGLRCIGPGFTRIAVRATDINGDVGITNAPWGPGIIGDFGLPICTERQFQVFYRGSLPNGVNTSNGVQVVILP